MKSLLMFLNERFQYFCEIDQRLLNATRYTYCFFELQLEKSNENNKFSFEFDIINNDENVNVF